MDLSCIISSGDLELYVLGMLPNDEAYKIEQLALLFDEVDVELNRIRETLFSISEDVTVQPDPSVRANFINTIRQLKQEEDKNTGSSFVSQSNNLIQPSETARVVAMSQKKASRSFFAAASIILMIVSIGTAIYLFNRTNKTEAQLANVHNNLDSIKRYNSQQQQQLQNYTHTLLVIQDPSYKKMELLAVPGKPAAIVQIYWHKNSHEVYVSNVSLPTVPSGKQYQLWAIVKGVPVSGGMLNDTGKAVQKMKTFTDADAFAITLENKGGSPTPTMEQMYVFSKVS
ncbi:MAG: anti-sigma factor [Segetibacter sp.]|nr:anti-sigma factor [Segetibacter sp.]